MSNGKKRTYFTKAAEHQQKRGAKDPIPLFSQCPRGKYLRLKSLMYQKGLSGLFIIR